LEGVPNDLPELKEVHAKLPVAYEGEDNFNCMDNWLQGILCYFKIHHLTGADWDEDRILVTETCMKGKAEHWLSQEVEFPTQIICDWTFESVIVKLYCMFITIAMVQHIEN
jgi:hypothetical protein